MDEDSLNMQIRKFLKKVGINSQRIIENAIHQAKDSGNIKEGDVIDSDMKLSIKTLNSEKTISDKITIE